MEHLLLKAATTAVDQGTFEAVISTASVDREKDVVNPQGMVDALARWIPTGKNVPLAWNHSTAADQQIGYIDPASAVVTNDEVSVKGWIDQSTETGAHAWRMVKAGTLGFSFGYLVPEGGAKARKGGGRLINVLDIFEATATTTPMNNDTRIVGWKAADGGGQIRIVQSMIGQAQEFLANENQPDDAQVMQDVLELLQAFVQDEASEGETETTTTTATTTGKTLRAKADDIALDHASGDQSRTLQAKSDNVAPDQVSGDQSNDKDDAHDLKALFGDDEVAGAQANELKAVWTTTHINELADSAFLYVEPGGDKDPEGKTTPRALRHFPYRAVNGEVDMPHLRNALARIPQSNLSQDLQDRLAAKAQTLLDRNKAVLTDKALRRSADPLRAKAESIELAFVSDGQSLRKPASGPPRKAAPRPELVPMDELKRRMRNEMLTALTGEEVE